MILQTAHVESDGQITEVSTYNSDSPAEGTVIDSRTIRYITDTILDDNSITDIYSFPIKFVWKDGAWFNRGVPATSYYLWSSGVWAVNTDALNTYIRIMRNSTLFNTDWTQMVDAPLTDAKKAEWVTYRQTLRDIMANLPADLDDPDDVVWPDTP